MDVAVSAQTALVGLGGLLIGVVIQAVITASLAPMQSISLARRLDRILLYLISSTAAGGMTYWLWHDLRPPESAVPLASVSVMWGGLSPLAYAVGIWVLDKKWPGLTKSLFGALDKEKRKEQDDGN